MNGFRWLVNKHSNAKSSLLNIRVNFVRQSQFEIMDNKKSDRRSKRTRKSLRDALFELILEKRYDSITVQDILDRADVGRSTFYAHYRDKEDLFRSDWEKFLDFLIGQINFENISKDSFVPIKELFQHLVDLHPFYRSLVKSRKSDTLFKTGQHYLAKGIENKMTVALVNKQTPSVPVSLLSNYLATEILAFLRWWLDQNMPYTPERMDEIFHQLITPGFRAALCERS
jgi:AcrR family transcriptional regulator